MPQKVLIIGAKGMLGKDLVKEYRDNNAKVWAWDREEIDIADKEMVEKKIKELDPDIIINAAAYNAVDEAEKDEGYETALMVNAKGPQNLARTAKEIQAVFLTYTSDYVFDGKNQEGYKEDDTPNPVNRYGMSKFEGEKRVQDIGGNYFIVRTSKIFGKEGTGQGVKKSFPTIMQELAEKQSEIKVVNEEISCFTYSPDLAKATRFLIEGNYQPGIYHIINTDPCSWYDCAKTLFEILGKKIKLTPVPSSEFPRPAKRPDYSVLINTKLPPLRSYKEAMKEFLSKAQ